MRTSEELITIAIERAVNTARRSQLEHEKRAAEVGVARGLRHRRYVAEGLHEIRARDETGRAPAAEARQGATHVSVEREQRLFTVLRTDAHTIRRVEAEDARFHVARRGQHAHDVVWRERANVVLRDHDGVFVGGT